MKLSLKNPLRLMYKTQDFGNPTPMYTSLGMKGHNGVDYRAPDGTPIYASHDGYAFYQIDNNGGHGVVLITDRPYEDVDGNKTLWKTIYWHLVDPLKEPKWASPLADKTGATFVHSGDIIGYADNTGRSTGSHLHYALKPVANGEHWGTWYNTEQDNGYFGAVDPAPYMSTNELTNKYIYKYTLKRGMSGVAVKNLQEDLKELGFFEYPTCTGYYGPITQRAVLAFQMQYKVITNPFESGLGYWCGPKTRTKLNSLK